MNERDDGLLDGFADQIVEMTGALTAAALKTASLFPREILEALAITLDKAASSAVDAGDEYAESVGRCGRAIALAVVDFQVRLASILAEHPALVSAIAESAGVEAAESARRGWRLAVTL